MAVNVEHAAHGLATRLPIDQVAGYLRDVLGQRLVAVIADISNPKAVGMWARGERTPHPDAEQRLRNAFQVTELLMRHESSETVRAWFRGMNPDLGDESPALMIREHPSQVLQAARAFLAS